MTTLSEFPLLPLRDVVVYPHMVIPLFVGRDKSIQALEQAMSGGKQVLLISQRDPAEDDPARDGLYDMGTVATILQLLKLPDGTVKVLVEGEQRARIESIDELEGYQTAEVELLSETPLDEREAEVLTRSLMSQFEQFVQLGKKVPSEVVSSLSSIDQPGRLVDTMAAHLSLKLEEKQAILEILPLRERVEHVLGVLDGEIDLLQVEKRIRGRVKKQMERSQREYYLNEQMKAIQKEMGNLDEGHSEFDDLRKKIDDAGMSEEALGKANAEFNKLKMMSPMSAEATVVRSYIDWLTAVPWKKASKVRHDIQRAEQVLDADHYGLEEVKERILEYLAVQKRVRKLKGPVLCLVGPPGVGKTSLGESLARATNRKFVRMALGGVRDEAEIRGHRRTYIGSLPGKLIQKVTKTGVKNPLFLLDEIDKMGQDMRGDPSSALLEVLDPEQNHAFNDHYLEVDYDLSDVMFICTANSMNIPAPLLDRMEIIRIPGYTEDEKINIAQRYLVPKQVKNNGLKKDELTFSHESLRDLVRYYTREAGVRGLERQIAKVCRKVVKEQAGERKPKPVALDENLLEHYLGVRKFKYGLAEESDQIGQVTGLAWTQVGGELLSLEAVVVPGKGRQIKTGSLGDVMQESISAALTVVRSRAASLGIKADFHENNDIHIHVPEGATPKDGPSAGVGMCTALVSSLTKIPVRADVAMTGEITLRGQVLPIGGLKEKLLAAHRGGIKTVIIPHDNVRDLKEIPDRIKQDIDVKPVKWIDEVLQIALQYMPEPLKEGVEEMVAKDDNRETDEKGRISTH
ncbi:endopeptidase La [Pseudomonas neustonica]|uniref:Lon protease n=1 Tax=Pseudomonas neustonica TaxID=2487346 RepID=A0ABX9XNL2_9PSED|nr:MULTISPECIES: endopeptidase La [Pseudomonas]ROZ83886.1 endopeptidase La [Pseudomonas sp. SSM44]ROZ85887.1 endopeptidase La [Pseudomonas neustonica]|tara:strand:- start:2320 stop:4719 length:2400 start_codon:yes stop_codon:yes gene_type:complete